MSYIIWLGRSTMPASRTVPSLHNLLLYILQCFPRAVSLIGNRKNRSDYPSQQITWFGIRFDFKNKTLPALLNGKSRFTFLYMSLNCLITESLSCDFVNYVINPYTKNDLLRKKLCRWYNRLLKYSVPDFKFSFLPVPTEF